jgi:hypothetical protein
MIRKASIAVVLLSINATFCDEVRSQSLVFPGDRPISYAAVRTTEGEESHAYGFSIELCRHGDEWTGFLAEFMGPVADPPMGKLEDLQLSESLGTIAFTVRLTAGMTIVKGEWVPMERQYSFSGRIAEDALFGSLVAGSGDGDIGSSVSEEIELSREYGDTTIEMSCDQWSALRTQAMFLRSRRDR